MPAEHVIQLAHQYYNVKNMCKLYQQYQLKKITNLTDNINDKC